MCWPSQKGRLGAAPTTLAKDAANAVEDKPAQVLLLGNLKSLNDSERQPLIPV
jgi:hypothetical protein